MNCESKHSDDIKKCFDCIHLIAVKGVYDVDTKRESFLAQCDKFAYILIQSDRPNYRNEIVISHNKSQISHASL